MPQMTREEIDALNGRKPAAASAPAPVPAAPPAPVPDLTAFTEAMTAMSQAVAESARAAARVQADVAALATSRPVALDAEIVRDQHGKMCKVIITPRKN